MKFNKQQIKAMQDFIWAGFCDPAGVGVNFEDVLTGARFCGVDLADAQIKSVVDHYAAPDEWDSEDEKVRDAIAEATDCENGENLFQWLAFIVGDTTAESLVKEWKNEAH